MVVLFLVFKGTSILFCIAAAPIYIPTNSARGLLTRLIIRHEFSRVALTTVGRDTVQCPAVMGVRNPAPARSAGQ